MRSKTGRWSGSIVVAILGATVAAEARGQGNTFNPYGNSGYPDYREFATPMYSNSAFLPGQTRLDGQPVVSRSRTNTYQDFVDRLGDDQSDLGPGRGQSASRSGRPTDDRFGRAYRPNNTREEREFRERQARRDELYFQAIGEKDPIKRARLLREVDRYSLSQPATTARAASPTTSRAPQPARSSAINPAATRSPAATRQPATVAPGSSPAARTNSPRRPTPTPTPTPAPTPPTTTDPSSVPIAPPL